MGAVAADLHAVGHRPTFFYLQHAMGLGSSVGLGIALAQPDRHVVVLDGDGSVLMNLGGLTTLARAAPPNLTHVIFDNENLLSAGAPPPPPPPAPTSRAWPARPAWPPSAPSPPSTPSPPPSRDGIATPGLAVVVAKIDASGPASFAFDLGLKENRFAFARALRR